MGGPWPAALYGPVKLSKLGVPSLHGGTSGAAGKGPMSEVMVRKGRAVRETSSRETETALSFVCFGGTPLSFDLGCYDDKLQPLITSVGGIVACWSGTRNDIAARICNRQADRKVA